MHVVFDLSAHGYGHAGMSVALIAALARRLPDTRITVRSGVSGQWLRERIKVPFEVAPAPPDPVLAMLSPFEVDAAASAARYTALFGRWDPVCAAEASALRDLQADLVVANVPFVSLAAAQLCGVPAIGCGPLNWADMYRAYCGGQPGAERTHEEILRAYRSARFFLQPQPSMPMHDLPNRRGIGPLAAVGRPQRDTLRRLSGARTTERYVLISFGGIAGGRELCLPQIPGVRWFVPDAHAGERADVTRHSASGVPFIDLVATCDVLITKPGYGMFAEAACNGVRVAYLPRHDWPEAPYLTAWLSRVGIARELREEAFFAGAFGHVIAELLALPAPARVAATGAEDAVDVIAGIVSKASSELP